MKTNWKIVKRTVNNIPYQWELSGICNHEIWRTNLKTEEAVKFWYAHSLDEIEFLQEIEIDIYVNNLEKNK